MRSGSPLACGRRSSIADHGFFLNGQSMKIQGTCNHQDHAGVGAALPDRLQAFRVGVLQGDGLQRVRTSHNMPTPELVEACDRMGMMMMCETRQMSSSPEGLAQLEDNGQALPQLAIDHHLVHRQRGVAAAEQNGRGGRQDCRNDGRALPRARPDARGVSGGEWEQREGRLRSARHHRVQLRPESSRRLPQGASDAAHLWIGNGQHYFDSAAATGPIPCATRSALTM